MIYRRVLSYYRPFFGRSALAMLLSFVGIALSLLKPWPFKIIIDNVIPRFTGGAKTPFPFHQSWWQHDAKTLVFFLCLVLVAIQLIWSLLTWATSYIFVKVGLQALLKLRTDLYSHLQRLSLKFHDARRSADSSFRVAYDSQSIQTIFNRGFTNIIGSVITLVTTFVVMWKMDWQLSLLSLIVVPALLATILIFGKRIRTQSTSIQEVESAVLVQVQEGLSSIRMVHAFGREDYEVHQFHAQAAQSLRANLRMTLTNMNSALVISTLMVVSTAAIYYMGTLHVLNGTLTLGSLIVFSTYILMLYSPLEQLTYTAWAMEGATAGAQRCFEVLDRPDDVADAPAAVEITETAGAIDFHDISFGYKDEREILHGINLRIAPNQIMAIVGGTGAGKSTLLSLVPRFYDPSAGSVTLDGRNLKMITKKSLRAQIGIVLQDTLLFSTTIRENIAYGRPEATEDEIVDAARRAQADDFIRQMPDGYSSQVGERGGHLSVGQRQRIGIARAFLKNAPILLLDEPTSALDPGTEAAIMSTIKELMKGRTTLIVTHRLGTIHRVNTIVVLKDGQIVEQGPGAELLAQNGIYAGLYKSGNFPNE